MKESRRSRFRKHRFFLDAGLALVLLLAVLAALSSRARREESRFRRAEKADLAVGEALNRVSPKKDHVASLVSARKEADRAGQYLSRSVSFGLLLLVLGLFASLLYLLRW